MNDNGFLEGFTPRDKVAHEALGFDTFLRDEGLELLKTYRSLEDEDVRRSFRSLIAMIAAAQGATRRVR